MRCSLYFAYGSNMHLHQMAARCQTSVFMGIGRISGWRWQINERGVANIVESPDDYVEGVVYDIDKGNKRQLDRNEGVSKGFYEAVYLPIQFIASRDYRALRTGYVAQTLDNVPMPPTSTISHGTQDGAYLSPTPSLDNQAQRQKGLACQNLASDVAMPDAPACVTSGDSIGHVVETANALVYVSSQYTTDGEIRTEYIDRMERALIDGYKLGLSAQFLQQVDLCIHRTKLSPDGNYGRSIPIQEGAASVAPLNEDHQSRISNRIDRAAGENTHMVEVRYSRYVVTDVKDRVILRKRRNSNPL